jgi:pimeloyl-ACP methyl ester carboxylesterase
LLTQGTASPRWLQVSTARVAEELPHAETAVIEGAAHSPHITDADVYSELIRAFVGESAGVAATAH